MCEYNIYNIYIYIYIYIYIHIHIYIYIYILQSDIYDIGEMA